MCFAASLLQRHIRRRAEDCSLDRHCDFARVALCEAEVGDERLVVPRFIGAMVLAPMNGGTTSGGMLTKMFCGLRSRWTTSRFVGVVQSFGDLLA